MEHSSTLYQTYTPTVTLKHEPKVQDHTEGK